VTSETEFKSNFSKDRTLSRKLDTNGFLFENVGSREEYFKIFLSADSLDESKVNKPKTSG